jgi:hypothetical protein
MPVPVTDVDRLQTYLRGVIGDAKHHAPKVDQIVLALAGAVISRKDKSPLEVRSTPRGMGRALTFTTSRGNRYALSYDHASQEIVLKDGNIQGPVLHRFDNSTPVAEVASVFEAL